MRYFQETGKPNISVSVTATKFSVTHFVALKLNCDYQLFHEILTMLMLLEYYKSHIHIHTPHSEATCFFNTYVLQGL